MPLRLLRRLWHSAQCPGLRRDKRPIVDGPIRQVGCKPAPSTNSTLAAEPRRTLNERQLVGLTLSLPAAAS
jgi:hypothetical protein